MDETLLFNILYHCICRPISGGGSSSAPTGVYVNGGWGVGWTVELKLNRKKEKIGFQRGVQPPYPYL